MTASEPTVSKRTETTRVNLGTTLTELVVCLGRGRLHARSRVGEGESGRAVQRFVGCRWGQRVEQANHAAPYHVVRGAPIGDLRLMKGARHCA